MFGKPQWFREKTIGWGLTPVRWQGWVYALAWMAVLCLPFLALLARHLVVEAMIWMGVSMGTLFWDVRQILRSLRVQRSDVVYIGEEPTEQERLATRNFDFQLRK